MATVADLRLALMVLYWSQRQCTVGFALCFGSIPFWEGVGSHSVTHGDQIRFFGPTGTEPSIHVLEGGTLLWLYSLCFRGGVTVVHPIHVYTVIYIFRNWVYCVSPNKRGTAQVVVERIQGVTPLHTLTLTLKKETMEERRLQSHLVNHEMIHKVMLVGLVWSFGVGVLVLSCCFARLSKRFTNLCF